MKLYEAFELMKKRIAKNYGNYREGGICNAVDELLCYNDKTASNDLHYKFGRNKDRLFRSWEFFSGSVIYPVPASKKERGDRARAIDAFDIAYEAKTMWHKKTEYGALRQSLLDHLITQCKKEDI